MQAVPGDYRAVQSQPFFHVSKFGHIRPEPPSWSTAWTP